MSKKLKPCPFCGDTPEYSPDGIHYVGPTGERWGAVVCCCTGPEVRTGYLSWEEWAPDAAEEWNKRAQSRERGRGQDD